MSDPRATGGDPGSARRSSPVSVARPDLDLTVTAEVGSLPGLRRSVTAWLAPLDLIEPDLGSVHVVLSELVANAIEASHPGEQVDVHLALDGGLLTVEVRNPSRRTEPVAIPAMADPLSPRGRGLAIVGSLTERLALAEVDGHTVARATLRVRRTTREPLTWLCTSRPTARCWSSPSTGPRCATRSTDPPPTSWWPPSATSTPTRTDRWPCSPGRAGPSAPAPTSRASPTVGATAWPPMATDPWDPPGSCWTSPSSPRSRATPWPAAWSWPSGATCGWPPATRCSACTAGAGGCRWWTVARSGCRD